VIRGLRFRRHNLPRFEAKVALPSPSEVPRVAGPGPSDPADEGSGRKLSGEEIQSVVRRHAASIAKCLQKADAASAPPKVDAIVGIEPTGRVSKVSLSPAIGNADAEDCLARALKAMRFRKHPDRGFQVTIPLMIEVRGP
jgi:hypothetical protein